MQKLTCKVCGFKARNLEPHIEKDHADKGGLDWYVSEFDCSEYDIVDPGLLDGDSGGRMSKIKIGDVELPVLGGTRLFVPKVTPHYHFAPFATNVCKDIIEKKNVMLVGHTGAGKTSVITEIGARTNQGVVRANMNGQTTIGDFVGLWTVKGGETVWVDGVLPMAMREGHWLIIDEIDFAEPAILSVLNSVLESNGKLCLKEKGHEIIEPHENFRVFATANTAGCMANFRSMYQGTNALNEAFMDRWRVYKVAYLPPAEEAKVLAASVPMTEKAATVLVRVANQVRTAFEKEEIQCTFSLRRLIDWGQMIIREKDAIEAAETTIFSKVSREDSEVIKGVISNIIPRKPSGSK